MATAGDFFLYCFHCSKRLGAHHLMFRKLVCSTEADSEFVMNVLRLERECCRFIVGFATNSAETDLGSHPMPKVRNMKSITARREDILPVICLPSVTVRVITDELMVDSNHDADRHAGVRREWRDATLRGLFDTVGGNRAERRQEASSSQEASS